MKYNTPVTLYGEFWTEDRLGNDVKKSGKIKDMWVDIVPQHGSVNKIGGTEVEEATTTQKIRCRILSIEKPSIDMYFVDSRGWKHEFLEFYPNYKNRDEWEIKTKIIYE